MLHGSVWHIAICCSDGAARGPVWRAAAVKIRIDSMDGGTKLMIVLLTEEFLPKNKTCRFDVAS